MNFTEQSSVVFNFSFLLLEQLITAQNRKVKTRLNLSVDLKNKIGITGYPGQILWRMHFQSEIHSCCWHFYQSNGDLSTFAYRPDSSTRMQSLPNVFGEGSVRWKAGRGDVITHWVLSTLMVLCHSNRSSSMGTAWHICTGKNPLQGTHYSSYTITVSQMNTRGWQGAVLGLMHTHRHTHTQSTQRRVKAGAVITRRIVPPGCSQMRRGQTWNPGRSKTCSGTPPWERKKNMLQLNISTHKKPKSQVFQVFHQGVEAETLC